MHQNLLEHMLEIRGVGIVDMMTLFGASAVKSDKRILIVIDLELWDPDKIYERLGIDEEKVENCGFGIDETHRSGTDLDETCL